jgi:hypothetical protein
MLQRKLHVRIAVSPQGARAEIAVEDGAVISQARTIEARTCSEAVDALALIAALMLDPLQAGGSLTQSAAELKTPEPSADQQVTATGEAANEPANQPASSEPPRMSAEQSGAPPATRASTLALAGSALLITGIAPSARPGFGLTARATRRFTRVTLALHAGIRAALPETQTVTDGSAALRWWSAHFNACTHTSIARGALVVLPCAAGELGALTAQGSRTEAARDSRRVWSAAGAGLGVVWQVSRRIGLFLAGEGLLPLVRDRYLLGRSVVHRVPTLTIRGELGVSVRLL